MEKAETRKSRTKAGSRSQVWSWVGQPVSARPKATGTGRYSRPLSKRDKVVALAFGAEIRRLRKVAQMSTRQLAELVGMSQPSIVYIETRGANIEMRLMWDFAEALGVEPMHLAAVCDRAVSLAAAKRK